MGPPYSKSRMENEVMSPKANTSRNLLFTFGAIAIMLSVGLLYNVWQLESAERAADEWMEKCAPVVFADGTIRKPEQYMKCTVYRERELNEKYGSFGAAGDWYDTFDAAQPVIKARVERDIEPKVRSIKVLCASTKLPVTSRMPEAVYDVIAIVRLEQVERALLIEARWALRPVRGGDISNSGQTLQVEVEVRCLSDRDDGVFETAEIIKGMGRSRFGNNEPDPHLVPARIIAGDIDTEIAKYLSDGETFQHRWEEYIWSIQPPDGLREAF